jgi:hypothetical protein
MAPAHSPGETWTKARNLLFLSGFVNPTFVLSLQKLEVFYNWKSGWQYYPISPGMFQQIKRSEQIHNLLDEWIKAAPYYVARSPDREEAGSRDAVRRSADRRT